MDNVMNFAEKTISLPSAEYLAEIGIQDVENRKSRFVSWFIEFIDPTVFLDFCSVSDDRLYGIWNYTTSHLSIFF